MNTCKRNVLLLAAAAALFLTGTSSALAQCTATATSTSTTIRAGGTTEALGIITISCTATPVTSVASDISVSLSPSMVNATAGAGSTTVAGWTATCSAKAPDEKSTFPCPSLSSTIAPVVAPSVTVNGNTVSFSFTPTVGAQTFTVQGIRVNTSTAGLTAGAPITASVAALGGVTGLTPTVVLGVVGNGLGTVSGFANSGLPVSLSGCSPTIPIPGGIPSVVLGNPDPSPTAANSVKVALVEGFLGEFVTAATSDNGSPGTQGIRFLLQLSSVPNGMVVYAPEMVSAASAATTGSVLGGGASTVITLVTGAAADGSGGVPLPGAGANRFDLITASNGTANVVYEVTTSASIAGIETVNAFVALAGTATAGFGIIGGSVSLAPVGPPTVNPALPQFTAAGGTTVVANVVPCGQTQGALPSPPAVLLDTVKLAFIATTGTNPTPQIFNVLIAANMPLNWTASVTSVTGGNWLTISPTSGFGDTLVTATVNSSSLPLGSYSASITISAPGATDTPQTLPVVLDVAGTSLTVMPSTLSFNGVAGGNLASQQLNISTIAGTVNWTSMVSTTSGGNWLIIAPVSGTTPGAATVSVNVAGLTSGTYQGVITISGSSGSAPPQTVNVTLTLGTPAPVIEPNGVVNGASFSKDAVVSPGSIASLFGQNLATTMTMATSLPLPTMLGGTQVLVNNVAVPLFYVSPTQINFQVPVVSDSTDPIVVVSNQNSSQAGTMKLAPVAPGIFTAASNGTGQGAVLNPNNSVNSAQNPAAAGSAISIFATGLGATVPPIVLGQPAGASPLSNTVNTPVVFIGGVQAQVLFSGLAPGFAGAYQVNAVIPSGTPAGNSVPVQITIGGATSNTVTIAVH